MRFPSDRCQWLGLFGKIKKAPITIRSGRYPSARCSFQQRFQFNACVGARGDWIKLSKQKGTHKMWWRGGISVGNRRAKCLIIGAMPLPFAEKLSDSEASSQSPTTTNVSGRISGGLHGISLLRSTGTGLLAFETVLLGKRTDLADTATKIAAHPTYPNHSLRFLFTKTF